MDRRITDDMIRHIGILAKLSITEEEKEKIRQDIEQMLSYVDCLRELDTEGIEPLSHLLSKGNVFREDLVGEEMEREALLLNAPEQEAGSVKVPKTI